METMGHLPVPSKPTRNPGAFRALKSTQRLLVLKNLYLRRLFFFGGLNGSVINPWCHSCYLILFLSIYVELALTRVLLYEGIFENRSHHLAPLFLNQYLYMIRTFPHSWSLACPTARSRISWVAESLREVDLLHLGHPPCTLSISRRAPEWPKFWPVSNHLVLK